MSMSLMLEDALKLSREQRISERHKEYYRINRAIILKKRHEYYVAHADELRQHASRWREQHPNTRREYYLGHKGEENEQSSNYKKSHRLALEIYSHQWRLEHQDEVKCYRRRWYQNNKVKELAIVKANRKVRLGNNCEVCGSTTQLQRHHPDYSKPLFILTLCQSCHERLHRRKKN